MYRRILTLTMLAALLTTSLFGIPLAVAAAHYYRADERIELERVADKAAIDVAADLFHGRFTGDLPATQDESTSLALYGADAARLGGRGPATADLVVQQALAGNTVHHLTLSDQFLVAVPIADGERAAYVVRASVSTSEVYPRILAAWALMLTLATLILLLTWRVARGQARRLASPLEHLSAAAVRLGDGDFSARSQLSGIPEIDSASAALNHTAIRIAHLIDRERAVTANTSHQLRTALTGLRLGLEQALDSGSSAADPYQAITEAIAATDRLETTINDLIALARDTTDVAETFPLTLLLNEVRSTWQGRLTRTGRALRITADTDLPSSPVSTAAVRQIVTVLIDNAVSHGVGTITVHARRADSTTAIDVSDEGTQLRQHDEAILFRGRDTHTNHGIGLPLARSLADAQGGRLRLTATSPTTFTLFLPTQP